MPLQYIKQLFSSKLAPDELPVGRIDPNKEAHQDFLSRIQGNILKSHGRKHSAVILFELGSNANPAEWRAFAASRITSALDQYNQALRAKNPGHTEELFCSFALSASGMAKFAPGLSTQTLHDSIPPAVATRGTVNAFHESFWDGMASDANSLGDRTSGGRGTPPLDWEDPYNDSLDGMWLLAHKEEPALRIAVQSLVAELARRGAMKTFVEYGGTRGREPFGFKDNIATSGFFKGGPSGGYWVNLPIAQVLLSDPAGLHTGGSFLVLRKLEQNVLAFREFESRLEQLPEIKELKASLGIKEAGALILGRERDGTPLVKQPRWFNFLHDLGGFQGDPEARRCPFHAHIRKANPRGVSDGSDFRLEKNAQFVRRGVVYDPENQLPVSEQPGGQAPSKNVGLLFMGYMSSIDVQFFHMQVSWMKSPKFPKPPTGPDLLLFAAPSNNAVFQSENAAPITCPFNSSFVNTKGGAYFYVPPIAWLTKG